MNVRIYMVTTIVMDNLEKKHKVKQNERTTTTPNSILNLLEIQQELKFLKNWKVDPTIIYSGEAWKSLTRMDQDPSHIYSRCVNNWISQTFLREWSKLLSVSKKLNKCFSYMDYWIDIGTWNGIVSNTIAHSIYNFIVASRLETYIWLAHNGEVNKDFSTKPSLICCDLSASWLKSAEALWRNEFHDLQKLFQTQYLQGDFIDIINTERKESIKLLTMFNVLANYNSCEIKYILKDMHEKMNQDDILMPSFFSRNETISTMKHQEMVALYNNKETEEWCVQAFCKKYKIQSWKTKFWVTWNSQKSCIIVSIQVPTDTLLSVDSDTEEDTLISASSLSCETQEDWWVKFDFFESYRRLKKDIEKLCEQIWFEILYRLNSWDWVSTIPIISKK